MKLPFLFAFILGLAALAVGACTDEEPRLQPSATAEETAAQQATVTPSQVVAPQTARDGPQGTFDYVVQPGDTVFSIARRFGTTVAVITELNRLPDASQITAGQRLIIPVVVATATPTATPPRTATPAPGGPSQLVRNGSRSSGLVALTFDMGGRVEPAVDIMNWLISNRVPATIFITGAIVDSGNTDAGRQVLALVAAHPDLFELANHSYSHPDFTQISAAEMRDELLRTEEAVSRRQALAMRPWFRPPFGAVNDAVLAGVGAVGYSRTVMWDVDTIDWRPEADGGPTAAQIVSKVTTNATGGSIVLMHLGGYNTLEALPGIVSGLRAKGLGFSRVGDLPGVR